jgi:hypothetical protein
MLALAYSAEGKALLERFSFLRLQNASAMPDGYPLYGITFQSASELENLLSERKISISNEQ